MNLSPCFPESAISPAPYVGARIEKGKLFLNVPMEEVVCAKFAHTPRAEKPNTKCNNLDAIFALGYRINSKKATQFRTGPRKSR
ncbi:virulence RhuM family protein [Desulfosporosinus sp. BICA1-9]|uniref:virulence RhuM family protein n=1 Tax=Desulfosporosinus sp. BICA1-9 TaxID=1531958 RepID=UPI00054C4BE9|nr:virulence RhuM family protein [Desulfosporosinus sp. BICA1-9]KJS89708.1 MAG: hypothetical protein JL57_05885 [Desulfosporosinus sp. BICA1-9]